MNEKKTMSTVKVTTQIMLIVLISRLFGFLREVMMGQNFGTSYIMDAYLIADTIPSIIFAAIASAMTTSFIPVYTQVKEENGVEASVFFTNNVINIVVVFLCVLSIVGMLFARPIISLLAIGVDEKTLDLAVRITRIFFPMIITIGINQTMIGYLQSNRYFQLSSFIYIPLNFILIISILFYKLIGIEGVCICYVIGSIVQILIYLPCVLKRGFQYHFFINIKDRYIRNMGALILPVLVGTAVQQIDVFVNRMLASDLSEGSISALNFANKVTLFVFGIISLSIATVIYPKLAELKTQQNEDQFQDVVVTSLNTVSLLTFPIMTFTMIFSKPLIQILFERGSFDQRATLITSSALFYYTVGMLAYGFIDILSRAFYSCHDTKTPMFFGIVTVSLNFILNLILRHYMGLDGLAFASSIAVMITGGMLFLQFKKKVKSFPHKRVIQSILRSMSASIIMGVLLHYEYNWISANLIQEQRLFQICGIFITILLGIVIYFSIMILFKGEEMQTVQQHLNSL